MAHQNPDLHKKEEPKGLQIIIWTDNPTTPTLAFHNCRNINDMGHELRFKYDGVSTGKTSNGRFDKRSIVGYAIEDDGNDELRNALNDVFGEVKQNPLAKTRDRYPHEGRIFANDLHEQMSKSMNDHLNRGGL